MQTVWTDAGTDRAVRTDDATLMGHGGDTRRRRRRGVAAACCALTLTMVASLSACGANGDSLRDFLPHIDGQELSAAKGSCEDALLAAGRAATAAGASTGTSGAGASVDSSSDANQSNADASGTAQSDANTSGADAASGESNANQSSASTTAPANGNADASETQTDARTAERDAWIAMAAACPDRFGEGAMRAALAGHAAGDAGIIAIDGGVDTNLAPVDGVTDQSASVIALAQDRAAFGFEVIAARDNANADDTRESEARRTVASLWAAHAGTDPRLKVYQVDGLSDGSGKATVGDAETNERAAIAMDAALEEIKGLTPAVLDGMGADARARAARVVVADVMDAFAHGYPADEQSTLR